MRTKVLVLSLASIFLFSPMPKSGAQASSGQNMSMKGSSMSPPKRIFISGHSLTNQPVPNDLAAIAASVGIDVAWNRQHLEGSSIKQRSHGSGHDRWTGYSQGLNNSNGPIDVIAEFSAAAQSDKKYDVLLITEQHSLLGSLVWNDTVRYLRAYQDRFAEQNPKGITYFFEPWLSLDNKNDPTRWIAYERAAAPVWRCIVEQTNIAIAAKGRPDRLVSLPAASALARLVERATEQPGLPGISGKSARETVNRLIVDDVHLTRLGNYYIALVTFASIFGRSPEGVWRPAEVTPEQAVTLQKAAQAYVSEPQTPAMSLTDCRDYVRKSFLWTYLGYANDTHWKKERGFFGALYLRAKLVVQWLRLFSSDGPDNPFAQAAYTKNESSGQVR